MGKLQWIKDERREQLGFGSLPGFKLDITFKGLLSGIKKDEHG